MALTDARADTVLLFHVRSPKGKECTKQEITRNGSSEKDGHRSVCITVSTHFYSNRVTTSPLYYWMCRHACILAPSIRDTIAQDGGQLPRPRQPSKHGFAHLSKAKVLQFSQVAGALVQVL
jgi:hypothetical protein